MNLTRVMPAEGVSLSRPIQPFDVAVIGGGAIGLSVGWRAAQRGLRVVVLERGRAGGGTSAVAAGMLAPIAEAAPTEQPLLRLGRESARRYPGFVADLRESSGADVGYLECGTLLAARDRDEAEALERELLMRQRLELPVHRLLPSQARRVEPALAPSLRLALEVPEDHAIEPRRLTAALAAALVRAGGELREGAEVAELLRGQIGVAGVRLAGGERIEAEQVVIAAGVWSSAIAGLPEDQRIPLHPVKGQVLRLRDPRGPGLLGRVLRWQGGYLVPRGDGRYLLGATMEERGFDTSVTAGAVFELLREARELVPGVDELEIDELVAGLRPASPDNTPAIGPAELPGLHWAVGHYRGGILLTPLTAEIVVSGLCGEPLPAVAADAAPNRFGAGVPVGA
jgi:glycine oxidase